MKRIYGMVAAMAALGGMAYLANCLWAQQAGQPGYQGTAGGTAYSQPAAAAPRVAVINMYVVLKHYQKWDFYRKELQEVAKRYEQYDVALKGEIAKETNKLKAADISAAQGDEIRAKIKDLQRKVEDNQMAAGKVVGEKGEAQVVQMYKEVEDAVKTYAVSQGLHLVLNYTDLTDQPDFHSARNITRKLFSSGQAGAACPFYVAPGMDISQAIVTMLNQKYQPPTTSTAVPAAQPH